MSAEPVGASAPRWAPACELDALGGSINRFGYVEPIVLDERTGRMVAGHGRRETLLKLKAQGHAPPTGVRAEEGDWLVPVVRGWTSKSDKDAEAYLLASNRHVELGGWDDAELVALLQDVELEGTGFTPDDLTELLDRVAEPTPLLGDPVARWRRLRALLGVGHDAHCLRADRQSVPRHRAGASLRAGRHRTLGNPHQQEGRAGVR